MQLELNLIKQALLKSEWTVRVVAHRDALAFIEAHHYARGASNTSTFAFGLFRNSEPEVLMGALLWMPPIRNAAKSINPTAPAKVLALSRMAVHPWVPRNACSFMLSRAARIIRRDRRYNVLVAYSDSMMRHTGAVYGACGWVHTFTSKPYPAWLDSQGQLVCKKATVTRRHAWMDARYQRVGPYVKYRWVRRL